MRDCSISSFLPSLCFNSNCNRSGATNPVDSYPRYLITRIYLGFISRRGEAPFDASATASTSYAATSMRSINGWLESTHIAIESVGNGYETGEEPTDFNKLFGDEIAKLKASSSLVPQNDPLFRQFTTAIWASTILEYDLGAERDLFEAPKLIIEEPMIGLYPITATISMISGGEDVISTQALKVVDIESMQNEQQHL